MMANMASSITEWKVLQDIVMLGGLYFIIKSTIKFVFSLYVGFKTFLLPKFWPRNFPEEFGSWAIVTGCSKGIGLSYANELAKRGMNLVLIARKAELLQEIAKDITKKYGVKTEIIIADFGLATEATYSNIEKRLTGKDIGILVNNVGVAYKGIKYFHEISAKSMQNMVQVNATSMVLMSRMVLPLMEAKKKGAIINIASMAGLGPQPFITLYSATKSFVDFFSRGLAYEYDEKGIIVQCVYPGPVETDMLNVKVNKEEKLQAALIPTPDAFATQAIASLGFSNCTTGYWSHALLTLPGTLKNTLLCKYINKQRLISNKDE